MRSSGTARRDSTTVSFLFVYRSSLSQSAKTRATNIFFGRYRNECDFRKTASAILSLAFKTRNVKAENSDFNSMLNWYKQLIELRKTDAAIRDCDNMPHGFPLPGARTSQRREAAEGVSF